jgi:spore coat polysaccharide biosynthesis protein SpsF (cytidylyltransferase family)
MSTPRFGCVAGLQAELGPCPWPGDALADLCGKPLVQRVYERVRAAALVDEVVVLTSRERRDDALVEVLERLGLACRRGSAEDVRSRYLDLAEETRAQALVRLTCGSPFVDPDAIDLHLGALRALGADVVDEAGVEAGDGRLDGFQVFSTRALRFSSASLDTRDAEHVGRFFFARRPECLTRAEIEASSFDDAGLRELRATGEELERARRIWSAVDHEGDGSFPLGRALRWIATNR